MTQNFKWFIESTQRNAWIQYGPMDVYIRRGIRIFETSKITPTLEIASATIEEPFRGRGTFKRFLRMALRTIKNPANRFQSVYIECVHNDRLFAHLTAHSSFKLLPGADRSFYTEPLE